MNTLFIILQYCLPHHLLSRLTGKVAASTQPWLKNRLIRWFIRRYQVDMSEAQGSEPEDFSSFNDFFTRPLKPEARVLDSSQTSIISPVDGVVSAAGRIHADQLYQAKGIDYSLETLLGGDRELAQRFTDGHFATTYLSPRDYHRVHMPATGKLEFMRYVPGRLFSVNPVTTEGLPGLFTRNERAICLFETPAGPMVVILVGAMIVAAIETVWAGQVAPDGGNIREERYGENRAPILLSKGDEMGRFLLGSTVIVLFGPDQIRWHEGFLGASKVQLGQVIGHCNKIGQYNK